MSNRLDEKVLWIGIDDSNHAGDKKTAKGLKGEIIVAIFSHNVDDWKVRVFPNRRDCQKTEKFLQDPLRDFRFTLLTAEAYRTNSQNLPVILPFLVQNFFKEREKDYRKVYAGLDGYLNKDKKSDLGVSLSGICGVDPQEDIKIRYFLKKGFSRDRRTKRKMTVKRPKCPSLIYHADVKANSLLDLPTIDLLNHPKMVALPPPGEVYWMR